MVRDLGVATDFKESTVRWLKNRVCREHGNLASGGFGAAGSIFIGVVENSPLRGHEQCPEVFHHWQPTCSQPNE